MIETNYQVTCDNCEMEGQGPTIVHSQAELGEVTLRTFIKHLKDSGWTRGIAGDVCPACVRSLEKPMKKRKRSDAD